MRTRLALLLGVALSAAAPAAVAESAMPTYADAVRLSDRAIADAQRRADAAPNSAMALDALAALYLSRAQLTGHYADYLDAERVQRLSLARAPQAGAGCLALARLHLSLHRIDAAAQQFARCPPGRRGDDNPARLSLRAEIAFQHGDYVTATAGYRRALAIEESLGPLAQLAIVHARLGHDAEAAALLARAQALYYGDSAQVRAWLSLQQGLLELDRGHWNEALAHYRQADRALPGWWLVQEHIAEIDALRGNAAAAERRYRALVEETANPEFMDALAQLAVARGDDDTASQWVVRAEAAYRQRSEMLPEATIGHSLDHWLRFRSTDPQTLALAEQNVALRPSGEARLKLAEAHLLRGDSQAAWKQVDIVLRSGWDTAQLHQLAAEALHRLGRRDEAARESALALRRNPRAARMYALPPPYHEAAPRLARSDTATTAATAAGNTEASRR